MICPVCKAWTSILETRTNDKDNTIWRRKECGNKHVFTTLEQIAEGKAPRPNRKIVDVV